MKISKILPLAAALASFVPSFTLAGKNVTLSILTYNVDFTTSPLSNKSWNGKTRAELIAKSDFVKNHDVVVLEECTDREACFILVKSLKEEYVYQTPVIGATGPDKGTWDSSQGYLTAPENGGVIILSKWPIVRKHQFIYHEGCGADRISNKGFAYVVLDYQGANIHVFGTDMQSDYSGWCTSGQAALYRGNALDALRTYIGSKNIPVGEPVIITGGFNIKKDTDEFSLLLTKLDANPLIKFDGNPWTWDTQTNEIAQRNYPNDPPEYIDYILADKRLNADKPYVQTSLKVKSPKYTVDNVDYSDYSDHYPVRAVMSFDL